MMIDAARGPENPVIVKGEEKGGFEKSLMLSY